MKKIHVVEEIFDHDSLDVVYNKDRIDARVRGMADMIHKDYAQKDLVIICVLSSGLVFTADLMRAIQRPLELGFMRATSYDKGKRIPVTVDDFEPDRVAVSGRDVLIVDGICESGNTFARVSSILADKKDGPPRSIKTCAFARKRNGEVDYEIDYCGIIIPNIMIYGYGINHMGRHRNEPNIRKMVGIQPSPQADIVALDRRPSDIRIEVADLQPPLVVERMEKFDRLVAQLSNEWKSLADIIRENRG